MNHPNQGIEEVADNQRYPGLNIHDAMIRTGNKRGLLECLLKMFVEQHGADIERINDALQRGERGTAIAVVHSLAGTAGNLAAYSIYREARDFETILRDTASPLPRETPPGFSADFHMTISSMNSFLAECNASNT